MSIYSVYYTRFKKERKANSFFIEKFAWIIFPFLYISFSLELSLSLYNSVERCFQVPTFFKDLNFLSNVKFNFQQKKKEDGNTPEQEMIHTHLCGWIHKFGRNIRGNYKMKSNMKL